MPVTLTDRVVKQAKARGTRLEIPDAVLPGLYLIVQPTGAKSWAVRYRIGRRTRKLTLAGRYPVLSLARPVKPRGGPWRVFPWARTLLCRQACRNARK
jgi:hypothetical protein